MYVIVGKITVKPEHKVELIRLARGLVQPSRSEPGCISYGFFEDQVEENHFLFFEEWTDRAAIDRHFNQPYVKDFVARLQALVIGSPVIRIVEVASSESV
jgi:quinol monooxygenase YgiN